MLSLFHVNPDCVGSTLGVNCISADTSGSLLGRSSLNIVFGVEVRVRLTSSPAPALLTTFSLASVGEFCKTGPTA